MNMNIKKFIIVVIVALMSAFISFGRMAQAGPPGGADFALFTSQTDDYVTCSCASKCQLYILATNFSAVEDRINIVFKDGDSIIFRVPTGDSRSFTQYIATEKGVDDTIKIDPLDQVGDVNPMVMWISISGPRAKCDVH
ncbi:MAG: hypothetical protein AB1638_00795 [Nitrospirota bacterium]